jgi:hypothetical protein
MRTASPHHRRQIAPGAPAGWVAVAACCKLQGQVKGVARVRSW